MVKIKYKLDYGNIGFVLGEYRKVTDIQVRFKVIDGVDYIVMLDKDWERLKNIIIGLSMSIEWGNTLPQIKA